MLAKSLKAERSKTVAILDKKLLLDDLKTRLDDYIPANTAGRIITDLGELLTKYEVTILKPDGGGDDESKQLLRMYLDALEIEGKSEKTIAQYSYTINKLHDDIGVPLRKITVYHLRQYMMAEKNRGVSMTTIKTCNYVYSGFYKWLMNEGLISENPTTNIGTIKAKQAEQIPFNGDEVQLIKEACSNDLQRAIVYFLLSTGCRVSELCSVNRRDVDFQNLKLTVTGKGNKTRVVYIDNVTAMMLRRYLDTRQDIDPALFISRNKERFTTRGIQRMLAKIGERSHVPDVHPHRFRHTLATNLIDRGMSIQEVSAILGHAKLDTTMTYVFVNQRNTENSYRRYACM